MRLGYGKAADPDPKETDVPNAIELLTQEHREAEQMLQQLQGTRGEDMTLLQTAATELRMHMKIEEDVLYPYLRKNLTNGSNLMTEANKEHEEAKEALAQVERTAGTEQFEQALQTLTEGIQHHVEEEETEIFPKMREDFDEKTLTDFGRQLEEAKQQLRAEGWTGATEGMTRDELYAEAKEIGIEGRSQMNKDELQEAVEQNQ